jgi:CubicO group peptidase (beta-lactamase class C family)
MAAMRVLTAVSMTVVGVALATSIQADPTPDELEAFADKLFSDEIEHGPTAGASVLVGKGERILLAKGYGYADIENQLHATERTVYRLGSLSKQFTAVAVLQLVDQGLIDLDTSIRRYLPDYPEVGEPITPRHLLNHTSGLVSYTAQSEYWKHMRDDLPQEDVLSWFASRQLAFPPGDHYSYSNSGYFVLGLIIERVSGEAFGEYVKRNILNPLKLEATYYDDGIVKIPNKAKGYERDAGELVPARTLNTRLAFSVGAMASNVIDLFTFHRALRSGKLITPESYALMVTPAWLNDNTFTEYGMAFHVERWGEHRVFRHGGLIFGFKTCNYYYPDKDLTIIILMNTEEARYRPLQAPLARLFIPDLQPEDEFD